MRTLVIAAAVAGGLAVVAWVAVGMAAVAHVARVRSAEQRQADWEQHVEDALNVTAKPLYDAIAEKLAENIDAEWAEMDRTAGA